MGGRGFFYQRLFLSLTSFGDRFPFRGRHWSLSLGLALSGSFGGWWRGHRGWDLFANRSFLAHGCGFGRLSTIGFLATALGCAFGAIVRFILVDNTRVIVSHANAFEVKPIPERYMEIDLNTII